MTTPSKDYSTMLVKYGAMCSAIEQARAVDEVKDIRDKALAIQAYAHQAKNYDAERHAAEIRIRAERRCGELLKDMPKAKGAADGTPGPGRGNKTQSPDVTAFSDTQTLSNLGISKRQSSEWQKLAEVPESDFESAIAEQEIPTSSGVLNHRAMGTGQNEWYTPEDNLLAIRDVLGSIELDPASSEAANRTIGAARYFDKESDGLTQNWKAKTVFLNPPYAQPAIAQFVSKLILEVKTHNVDEAILLTHNYTDTAWFHEAQSLCSAICFTRGRIGFVSPEGERASPTQGQAFFYYGARHREFSARFHAVGFVLRPYGI